MLETKSAADSAISVNKVDDANTVELSENQRGPEYSSQCNDNQDANGKAI